MIMRRHDTQKGFSLVETLVAIAILLIAVLAPMRIVAQSIKASVFSREQLTAVFLAQEGLESMRRLRDNSAISGSDTWEWYDSVIPNACKNATGCSYDVSLDSFVACSGSNCRFYFDEDASSGVFYSHHSDVGEQALFERVITITEQSSGEVLVTSVVSWESSVLRDTISVTLETKIFDQYE